MRTSSTTDNWSFSRTRVASAECDIQILDFCARVNGPLELVRQLRELFPSGSSVRSLAPRAYAATFEVRPEASGGRACTIIQDGAPVGTVENPQDALASLEWAINNAAVEQLGARYVLFHAGAVAYAHQGILLPAVAGSGKTTLVAGLVAAGFQYLSDEVGALDPLTGRLVPFPKSLCVKQGSRPILEPLYPQLRDGTSRRRFGGAPMQYLTAPHGAVASASVPVRFVILPQYTDGVDTKLEPVTRSLALERFMEQSFSLPAHGAPGMRTVVEVLARADCYALAIGSLQEAVELVRNLACGSSTPRRMLAQTLQHGAPLVATPSSPPQPPSKATAPVPAPAPLPPAQPNAVGRQSWFRRRLAWVSGMGLALIAAGALVLVYGAALQTDLVPSAHVTVPRPAALDRPRPASVNAAIIAVPIASTRPTPLGPGAAEASAPAVQAVFGWARHLSVPSIGLETEVVPASMQLNPRGELEWQTVPFVAAHYVNTAPVGGPGNAVITGHVATIREGNVFRELDRIDYGERVVATSDYGDFTYEVDELKLVSPNEVSVMDSTQDSRLTLITCGGEFDPHTRTFSQRLIVIAKLVHAS